MPVIKIETKTGLVRIEGTVLVKALVLKIMHHKSPVIGNLALNKHLFLCTLHELLCFYWSNNAFCKHKTLDPLCNYMFCNENVRLRISHRRSLQATLRVRHKISCDEHQQTNLNFPPQLLSLWNSLISFSYNCTTHNPCLDPLPESFLELPRQIPAFVQLALSKPLLLIPFGLFDVLIMYWLLYCCVGRRMFALLVLRDRLENWQTALNIIVISFSFTHQIIHKAFLYFCNFFKLVLCAKERRPHKRIQILRFLAQMAPYGRRLCLPFRIWRWRCQRPIICCCGMSSRWQWPSGPGAIDYMDNGRDGER